MSRAFSVIALIAAFNEEDIIEACLDHLCSEGVQSYLLDDGSTDDTVKRAQPFVGRGLLGVEQLPPINPTTFSLDRILLRKEELAVSLCASWFINQDADEFRDSLWSELSLRAAIERVDRLGWNAIDFEIFTMRLVGDPTTSRAGPAESPSWFSRGADYDRLQIRAWKQTGVQPDLRSSAGHDVQFEGRLVFPLRFPMRHYPIRSYAHGLRKVLSERVPRFDQGERNKGWHIQYDRWRPEHDLVASPEEVGPFDPTDARILSALRNRDLEEYQRRQTELTAEVDGLLRRVTEQSSELALSHSREVELRTAMEQALEARRRCEAEFAKAIEQADSDRARMELDIRAKGATLTELAAKIEILERDRTHLHDSLTDLEVNYWQGKATIEHLEGELAAVYTSRSWRWTKPLRVVFRWLGGR
jgi:Glycosyl transferase family 2